VGRDWTLVDRIALVALVAMLALSVYGYEVLPAAARPVVFILPAVAAISGGIITLVVRAPQRLNLPLEVSDECQQAIAPMSVGFQRLLRAEIIAGLLVLELLSIESARGGWLAPLFPFGPLAFLVTIVGTVVIFTVRVWRIARG
jgi:hypothetical protein